MVYISASKGRYRKVLALVIFFVLGVTTLGGSVLAYDLTAQDVVRGDTIVQKINTFVDNKPRLQRKQFKEHIITLLEQLQSQSSANDQLSALVGYVVEELQNPNAALETYLTSQFNGVGTSENTSTGTSTSVNTSTGATGTGITNTGTTNTGTTSTGA